MAVSSLLGNTELNTVYAAGNLTDTTGTSIQAVGHLFARAKAGIALYRNANDVFGATNLGLDAGYNFGNGFVLTGVAKFNFPNSALIVTGQTTSIYGNHNVYGRSDNVSSMFFGVVPGGRYTSGITTLSYGVGVGALVATLSPILSGTRLAVAPTLDIDFAITSGLSANMGVAYVASLSETLNISFLAPTAGLGYRF